MGTGDCLNKREPADKKKYCEGKFPKNVVAAQDCAVNFCDRCCENEIDWMHKTQRFNCVKDCKAVSKPDPEENVLKVCIESPVPSKSMYAFCASNLDNPILVGFCKEDFCHLCCITSS